MLKILLLLVLFILPHATPLTSLLLPRNSKTLSFRSGLQLIYRKSLPSTLPTLKTGDLVTIKTVPNADGNFDWVGLGVYNEDSMYAVRILEHWNGRVFKELVSAEFDDKEIISKIFTARLLSSITSKSHLNLPSPSTDSYRLLNGEGSSLSGFSLDVYGPNLAVAMSSAAYVEMYKDTILECCENILGHSNVIWKNTPTRLKQDGYNILEPTSEVDLPPSSPTPERTIIQENSILYTLNPSSQKTGFYTDQRENRALISSLSSGKRVLDLCCYVGGFSLNAAKNGGAVECVGVDSSSDAIEGARENAVLNDVTNCEFVQSSIEGYMKKAIENGEEYDIVILDPPKLAPTLKGLDRASRKYHALNRDALKLIDRKNGGLLLTCTCSSAMSTKDGGEFFLRMIQRGKNATRTNVPAQSERLLARRQNYATISRSFRVVERCL
ncbi:hypothetical protein TL16_g02161 [Triparma laevis f. inornata]|uniref:Uncharacterized protein n=1 Tax=Triparma laevis f. inornata TaxID=1714386 RepID=A0A9W6ZP24_9STRA|nr:hypothetical protein TL16_g02161 [Triparma laevis f. inornata]